MDAVLDMIERQTAARFAGQIRALLARPDATSVLRAVRCPTLVLCGRDDAWAPLAQHREIAALIPDAELAIIEDSGHMSTMERPDAVAEALLRWLAREANGGADTGSRPRQASTGERSDPDSERLVEQPGHLARRFHQIAVSLFCEEFAPHDVTPAQYAILCTLDEQPGVDQVTLAGLLALDTSTSASVCARLEERGLVYRAQSDDDRRKKKLLLTEAGRRVVRATRASAHRLRERLLGPLAPREQREFLRLLERLVDANNALSRAPYQPLAAQAQP